MSLIIYVCAPGWRVFCKHTVSVYLSCVSSLSLPPLLRRSLDWPNTTPAGLNYETHSCLSGPRKVRVCLFIYMSLRNRTHIKKRENV